MSLGALSEMDKIGAVVDSFGAVWYVLQSWKQNNISGGNHIDT